MSAVWPYSHLDSSMRLKTLIASAILLVSLVLTAGISYFLGKDALGKLEVSIGQSLALLADQAQDKLDRVMFDRLQAMQNLSAIGQLSEVFYQPERMRASFERFRGTYADFAWIGLADESGHIICATDQALEGQSVAQQTWFRDGLQKPFVGAAMTAAVGEVAPGTQPKQTGAFIDISTPVALAGRTGVLGAKLGSDWVNEVRDTLLSGFKKADPIDVLVLDEAGTVLLGPPDLQGRNLALKSIRSVAPGSSHYGDEVWPDGVSYLAGASKSDGYRSYSGLRWIVLVREAKSYAFAPVERLRRDILYWGAAFSALAAALAWYLAARLSRPLLQLSAASESLRQGELALIPRVKGYQEVEVLSRSFQTLISELAAANLNLEGQVRERTKQLELQNLSLAQAKTEAERATDAKSRFLAAASHDLRQPLHAMILFTRALSKRVSDGEAGSLVAQMDEALQGLRGMFDALLNVSRLDAKLIKPHDELVPVSQIIDRVSAGARVEAQQLGLRFHSKSANWLLETDAALLETIARNLVSNALKFTKAGGITFATRRRAGQYVIDVWDTGPGLTREQCASIFDEFTRADAARGRINDGLGLGLSISRRYAELLGMRIEVCSRPGHGSRFSIVLPGPVPWSQLTERPLHAKSEGDLRGLRILILDDEPLIVSALTQNVNDWGGQAYGFRTPAEGEAAVRAGASFDAAIVDYNLRQSETGIDFIERLERILGRAIPVLVLSGGTDSDTLSALALKGHPWLTKPADPELVLTTLKAVVGAKTHDMI